MRNRIRYWRSLLHPADPDYAPDEPEDFIEPDDGLEEIPDPEDYEGSGGERSLISRRL